MTLFHRIVISFKRQYINLLIFFSIVTLLTALLASGLIVQNSIFLLRNNIWRQLPPTVAIDFDFDKFNEAIENNDPIVNDFEIITSEVISQIGRLPYVKTYDFFSTIDVFSRGLNRVLLDRSLHDDHMSLYGFPVIYKSLTGSSSVNIMDFELGNYELVKGRTFTNDEMNTSDPTQSQVIISYEFSVLNNLNIGDTIVLENNFYTHQSLADTSGMLSYSDRNMMASQIFELEIIGLHRPVRIQTFSRDKDEQLIYNINGFFVPLAVVQSAYNFLLEQWRIDYEALGINIDLTEFTNQASRNRILLYDAIYLPYFIEAAQDYLPLFYKVATFSNSVLAIQRLDSATVSIVQIIGVSIIVLVILTITALSLSLIYLLKQRTNEISIYLILGQKKHQILYQFFLEMLLPGLLGVLSGIFLGNLLSSFIGRGLLINNLMQSQNFYLGNYGWSNAGAFLMWFINDLDSIIKNSHVGINFIASMQIISLGIITILFSTFAPSYYFLRQNPKKLITDSYKGH